VPKAFERALDGLGRVGTIVKSMKTFAHPDSGRPSSVDLRQCIQATLELSRNEYKFVADVATDLADLAPLECYAGELNQVVLNLVINAGHAIADRVKWTEGRGLITVRTFAESGWAVIAVQDTGTGIRPEIQTRIFDPFFTTKEPGRGTGQGLAISRKLVVDKMKGRIEFETVVGEGTTFFLRLPVNCPGGA
jgi:signal transduction histidine kinase